MVWSLKGTGGKTQTWWLSTSSCFISSRLDHVFPLGTDNSGRESDVLEGQLTIVTVFKTGYKFFWIGRHSEELREVGMGFSVRIDLINFTKTFSKDSVMASYYDTVISAYAPTMTTQ